MADPVVRFVSAPRALIAGAVSDMVGFRVMGYRMLERARQLCPVGGWESGADPRGHLRDTLTVRFITGADPRILVGSKTKGDVLGYLYDGTVDHFVAPRDKKALSWVSGGLRYFSAGHTVSGIKANPFPMRAMREIVLTTGRFG